MTNSGERNSHRNPANWAAIAARVCFSIAVLLIPFRLHLRLLSRPETPVYTDYTDFLLYASDVAVLLMLALWASSLAIAPRRLSFGPRHLWIPFVGLTATAWISALTSYDPLLSVYHGIRLVALFWFYVYVVNEIPSLHWVMIPVGIQATIQAIVALGQFTSQGSIGLTQLGELVLNPSLLGTSVVTANGERLLRAYGLTDHPNILGGCLAFSLVVLLLLLLRASTRSAIFTNIAASILISTALLVTFSRSAWIALAAGAAILIVAELAWRRSLALKRFVWVGLASAILPAAIVLAYSPFFGVRLGARNSFLAATAEQQSLGERLILVQDTMPILRDHLLTGVGIGASPEALQAYYPKLALNYEPPHWTLFDAALETGVLGAICYLGLLVFPLIAYIYRRGTLFPRADAALAVALLVSIATVGFFDYYTWLLPSGRLWQWLAWGIWGMTLERRSA